MKQIKTIFTPDTDKFEKELEKLINDKYTILHINSAEGGGSSTKPYHFFAVLEKEI